MRIYVAGHRGMVGSAVVRRIETQSKHSWIGADRADLDLTDRKAVFDYLHENKPDALVIAAAKVGGILSNQANPVQFLSENLQIQNNLIDGAHRARVEKLLFLGSSCIYPKFAPQPIVESSLLTGPLEPTNEPYAIAKIAGVKLVQAYRKQHGHKWFSLLPSNLYGPNDNYDPQESHVIPGLLSKFYKAKLRGKSFVSLWGSGNPLREFLHTDDLSSAILYALENYREGNPLNVGSGEEISIKELAREIKSLVGFPGEIHWDLTKPDGTPRKVLDSSKIRDLGWAPSIQLKEGLAITAKQVQHDF